MKQGKVGLYDVNYGLRFEFRLFNEMSSVLTSSKTSSTLTNLTLKSVNCVTLMQKKT